MQGILSKVGSFFDVRVRGGFLGAGADWSGGIVVKGFVRSGLEVAGVVKRGLDVLRSRQRAVVSDNCRFWLGGFD